MGVKVTLNECYKQLEEIAKLPPNWNENNADNFPASLINKAKHILGNLIYEPSVYPTARNSIQMEYENNLIYFEIEIFTNKIEGFSINLDSGKEQYYEFKNTNEINMTLKLLFGGV